METWTEVVIIFLLSSVKLVLGISTALLKKYLWWEIMLVCASGGVAGTLFFYYAGISFFKWVDSLWAGKRKINYARNKRYLEYVKKYGMWGIIVLTPVLLSIPVGNIIGARYFRRTRYFVVWMVLSVIGWTLLLALFSFLWH